MRGSKRKLRTGVWELRVSLGKDPATGRYRQLSRTFHGSARAADDAMRDLVDKHGDGSGDGIGATFGQLLEPRLRVTALLLQFALPDSR